MMKVKLTGQSLVYFCNAVAAIAIFFSGYDQGVMSGVNISPDYIERMQIGHGTTITNASKQGGIVAIYYLGVCVGAVGGASFSDRYGRLKAILLACGWIILGATLQASAMNSNWMLCARLITGIGTGICDCIVPVWSSEVSGANQRGAFFAFELGLNYVGITVSYWIAYGLSYLGDGSTQVRWRFALAFQMAPVFFLIFFLLVAPESPRWLVKNDDHDEARIVLGNLRGAGDPSHPMALAEYQDIVAAHEKDLTSPVIKKANYFSMAFWMWGAKDENVTVRVWLAFWMFFIQQWTGVMSVVVYAPTVFAQAGFSANTANLLAGFNNVSGTLFVLIAVFVLDRFGRRKSIYWGSAGQAIAMFLGGGFSRLTASHPEMASSYGGAAAAFIFIYNAIFCATWLTVPWVYPPEIFPLGLRAKGVAIAFVGWGIGCGSMTFLVPVMVAGIKEGIFYVFGAVNIFSIPIMWALYPETANRTLEELDLLFATGYWFVPHAERAFEQYKLEHPEFMHAATGQVDTEKISEMGKAGFGQHEKSHPTQTTEEKLE